MLDVVCVKWGQKYGHEYVNILRDMVARNLSAKHNFICYTDNADGIGDKVEVRPIPHDLRGWWGKLYLFKPGQFEDRVLYIDLDTVILGDLTEISEYSGDFAILRDFYRPEGYGSGLMAWRDGFGQHIWESFKEAGFPEYPGGDQAWIEKQAPDADIWQDLFPGQVVSYKVHAQDWPPGDARVVCFHGIPNPHECGGWVPQVWKEGGIRAHKLSGKANTSAEYRLDNVKANLSREVPWFDQRPAHTGKAVLCCGGPSLGENIKNIRARARRGHKIWCVNGAHDFLISKGIVPDAMVMLDSRPENTVFLEHPRKGVTYYLASQCHANAFKALSGRDVVMWHTATDGIEDVIRETPDHLPDIVVGGGGTVGLRALNMLFLRGYRDIHVYGLDGSYREGQHHAYKQSLNDGEHVYDVTVKGETFKASFWMIEQAKTFQRQAKALAERGVSLTVHGSGLIPFIASQLSEHYGEFRQAAG